MSTFEQQFAELHRMARGEDTTVGAIRQMEEDKGMNVEAKADELKPCPFCGGKAERGHYDGIVWIECTECEASTKGIDTGLFYEQAIAAWNRRVLPKSEVRATPESVDKPIEVRCPACGCPVVEHRIYADNAQVGERIECACGYKRHRNRRGDGWMN